MVLILEWAPFCFEVEHVELGILLVFVDQSRFDVQLGVSKGAQTAVQTFVEGTLAILCLIFFNMV
jgi:hypothetical protein